MNAAIGQAEAQATEADRIVNVFTLVRPEAPVHPVGRISRLVRQQDNAAIALDWNDF